jgi:prepilin-type processing-associated H-X9-DG protein
MIGAATMTTFSRQAFLSFMLGLASVLLNALTAVPALVLGLGGLREINRSDGRLGGRWMSIAGMILGVSILLADLLAFGAYVLVRQRRLSNRMDCMNNLRQIGMAVEQYVEEHQTYPPGTVFNAGLAPDQRLSWYVSLLPYWADLEGVSRRTPRTDTIYFQIDATINKTLAWDAPANRDATHAYMRVLICPAHYRLDEPLPAGPTFYVGIAGLGADAGSFPLSNPHCGMFGFDRVIARADVPLSEKKGESNLMMVCETAFQVGPWVRGGFDTIRGVDLNDLPFTGPGRPFGGLHPGITNLLMADGHAEPYSDDADPKVFAAMATLKEVTVNIPDW